MESVIIKNRIWPLFITMTCIISFSIISCGGTSTEKNVSDTPSLSLNGEFIAIELTDDELDQFVDEPGNIMIDIMNIEFDGSGNGSYQTIVRSSGSNKSGEIQYDLQSDGRLTADTVYVGGVSPDGRVLSCVDTDATNGSVNFMVGIKKSSGMSVASFQGEYFATTFYAISGSGGTAFTVNSIFAPDGSGRFDITPISVTAGLIDLSNINDLIYSVASDGTLSTDIDQGILSADGNMFILADTDVSDGIISVTVGIKKSSGMSNADLTGDYYSTRFEDQDIYAIDRRTSFSTLTLNGAGQFILEELAISEGLPCPFSGSYSVTSEGYISLSTKSISGIVSANGQIVLRGTSIEVDDNAALELCFKKYSDSDDNTQTVTIDVASYANIDRNGRWEYITEDDETRSVVVLGNGTKFGDPVIISQEYDGEGDPDDQSYWLADMSAGLYYTGGINNYQEGDEYEFYWNPDMPYLLASFVPEQEYSIEIVKYYASGEAVGDTISGTISVVQEAVTVPAGTYRDCYKVTLTFSWDGESFTYCRWYAKDVGLVKRIGFDRSNPQSQWELTSYIPECDADDFIGTWAGSFICEGSEHISALTIDGDMVGTYRTTSANGVDLHNNLITSFTNDTLSFDLPVSEADESHPDCVNWDVVCEATLSSNHTTMTLHCAGTFCGSGGGKAMDVTDTLTKVTDSNPTATITNPSSSTTISRGETVNFQGAVSNGNSPYTYSWDFDGGAFTSTDEDPGSTIFNTAGTYVVTFTLTDRDGDTNTDSVVIQVREPDTTPAATIDSPASNITISVGQSVNFQGSVESGNEPFTYLWNFDGGASNSTQEDPGIITFDMIGIYTISFTVTDGNGDASSDSVVVQVNEQETEPVFYKDADGDTFGDPNASIEAVSQPTGYVLNSTDCNDSAPDIFPGAIEIANDGIDQDCNGSDLVINPTTIISCGADHTVALKNDGSLWAWGNNFSGQLGDGSNGSKDTPLQIGSDLDWTAVDANIFQTVALKSDGTLWAWGNNSSGELGDGSTTDKNTPVQIGFYSNWAYVKTSLNHTAAIKSDGSLWAWGRNNKGQLGDGTNTDTNAPIQIGSDSAWTAVAAGQLYTIALKDDGTLWAWGDNEYGQLGDGSEIDKDIPVQIGSDSDWSYVASGYNHTVALKNDGSLWAWGRNNSGQLGDGSTTDINTPKRIGSDSDWMAVNTGARHTIALKTDGSLWAWGMNYYGQLGDGSNTDRRTPVRIGTDSDWFEIAAGVYHTIATKEDGSLWAWGNNEDGQLGDGTNMHKNVPVQISLKLDMSVTVGSSHTLVLKSDGTLWAWGWNEYGQLGDGSNNDKNTPVQIDCYYAFMDWAAVTAGGVHTVALTDSGILFAWGANENGQLGDGTNTDKNVPVRIGTELESWATVVAGFNHTVALKNNGTLWAWGNNSSGQLGDGTNTDKNIPVQIGSDSDWAAVEAGDSQTVALKNDGTLWAWGDNGYGQLGDGSDIDRYMPVQIGSDSDWVAVDSGFAHTVALKNDGTIWTWGDNGYGQLGDGSDIDKNFPVQIGSDSDWSAVQAGSWHTLALKNDGTLWAWGYNGGTHGDGTDFSKNTPEQSGLDSDWAVIATWFAHTAALKRDGSLWSWGLNRFGQLGDGSNTDTDAPVQISIY